jgi:CRP/FNR family cyclic AMP-dependent transcriptional regulator
MTIIEKVLALQDVELFSHVSTEALAQLAAIAHEESFNSGDDLFRENDAAEALHLILSGQVRLHRGGRDVTQAGAGDVLGTWALLDVESRVATATVTEPVHVLRIDRADFFDLIADNLEITRGVLRALTSRVRRLIEPSGPSPDTAS